MDIIRDRGKSEREAAKVQAVVAGLGASVIPTPEPVPDVAGRDVTGYTMTGGWDSEGRYIFPNG